MKKISKVLILCFLFFQAGICYPALGLDALDYEVAVNLYQAGENKKALKAVEKIEKEGGLNAEIALLKFEIYKKSGKMKEAKEALLEAVELDGGCYEAYIALAILEIENNNPNLARVNFKKAIELCPEIEESPDILYYYAKLCIMDKDFDSALQNILSAIELNGDEPLYYLELGKIYLFKKEYLRAVNALEYSIGEDEEINSEAYNYLGLANYRRGNLVSALNFFEKASSLRPENMVYLNNLAMCYKSLGEQENFEKTVNKLGNLSPNTPNDYVQLAGLLISKKNIEGAKKALSDGLERFPDNMLLKEMLSKLNKS